MAEPMAGIISPETRAKLATASATGRLLFATFARWIDLEARPAVAALDADLLGLSDEDTERVAKSVPAREDPDRIADAMVTIVDAINRREGMTAEDWRLVEKFAGEWVASGRR